MKNRRRDGNCETRIVFNGPVHQVNIHRHAPARSPKVGSGGTGHGGEDQSKSPPVESELARTFSIMNPSGLEPYETTAYGVICTFGYDDESVQLRAYIFGGREPGDRPTKAERDAAFENDATIIPHHPHVGNWISETLPGAVIEDGKVNYLYVWQVLQFYPHIDKREHERVFTSVLAPATWCDLHKEESAPVGIPLTEHPDLFSVTPLGGENHGSPSDGGGFLTSHSNPGFLVRDPASHEDYPAWRTDPRNQPAQWVLQQSYGTDGRWHAVLRLDPTSGQDLLPQVWASTGDWSNLDGGILVAPGLPDIEVKAG